MKIIQQAVQLSPRERGFHLITREVARGIPGLLQIKAGLCHVFIRHTSASIAINEDADPTVRKDFENFFNALVPESDSDYKHQVEGPDDMPAHLKSAILGTSVTIPVRNGELALGTWQGIYLCEHRDSGGGERELVITVIGE